MSFDAFKAGYFYINLYNYMDKKFNAKID